MASVYLAHPFAKKAEGKRVQTEIEKLGITVINPFERGEQAIYDKKLAPGGGGLNDQDCEDIVKMDLKKIDDTDAVVALMIDEGMIGTIMEIQYAGFDVKHPIFVLAPTARLQNHPWIRFYTNTTGGAIAANESGLLLALEAWVTTQTARKQAA